MILYKLFFINFVHIEFISFTFNIKCLLFTPSKTLIHTQVLMNRYINCLNKIENRFKQCNNIGLVNNVYIWNQIMSHIINYLLFWHQRINQSLLLYGIIFTPTKRASLHFVRKSIVIHTCMTNNPTHDLAVGGRI